MVSDILFSVGFGLANPIIAIFFSEHIEGGSLFVAGVASAIFLVTKSAAQIPMARWVDKNPDAFDIVWLVRGSFLVAAVPFLYLLATNVYHIYLIQAFHGVGTGIVYATWLGLWSTHLDKHRESFEWSLYSTSAGVATALAAVAGGYVADRFGFHAVFTLVGFFSLLSATVLAFFARRTGKHQS